MLNNFWASINSKILFTTGSYVAPLAAYLSWKYKIKFFIQEQNIYAGLGNKIASYFKSVKFTSYPNTININQKNLIHTGPVVDKKIQNNKSNYNKEITMYCANPDFETVESNSNNNIFCMGTIGEIYKKMGGNVIIKGKPDVSIYTATTNQINLEKKRTVAIGDSLFHDIHGANNFEIDSVLVKSGIHKDLTQINNLIKNHQIVPTYIIDKFSI